MNASPEPASPELELTAAQLAEIDAHLRSGQLIQAIKSIRDATGCGLAEAKAYAERRAEKLRAADPQGLPKPAGKGCFGVLVLLAAAVGAILFAAWRA